MFEAGEVFLPDKGKEWVADVEAELYAFPNGRNDDYVDTVSQYLSYARDQNVRRGVRKLNTGFA
jgi:phage terminase large subunit-like protein